MTSKLNRSVSISDNLDLEEKKLANKLRHELCDKDGKERGIDKFASGEILHQLGLIYMERDSDKIDLIQSAALFVAAQIRCCESSEAIQEDLEKLWSIVLHKAKAKTTLIPFQVISHDIQKKVNDMRTGARENLEKVPKYTDFTESDKIPKNDDPLLTEEAQEQATKAMQEKISCIKSLQNDVTDDYISIMRYLTNYICEDILNLAPCKFAFVGLGSLARREVTPYSDFECIIVLEDNIDESIYESTVEYFRWFAVIFQIVLISLGETILPNLAISSLNDFYEGGDDWFYDDITPSGIHFDGFMPFACKTPLGRQKLTKNKGWKTELIKPLKKMLAYLGSEENLKNGYHLADVLTQFCYVAGDNQLYGDFEREVDIELHKLRENDDFIMGLKDIVERDLKKYDAFSSSALMAIPQTNYDIKSHFYRSLTIFISALGKYYRLPCFSSFDIISKLEQDGTLSAEDAFHLSYAVAISCELRQKCCEKPLGADNIIAKLTEKIGEKAVVDYLAITRSLQKTYFTFRPKVLKTRIVLRGLDYNKFLVSFWGFSWFKRTIRYCGVLFHKVKARNIEMAYDIWIIFGWSMFCEYNAKEAQTKFSEWVFKQMSSKGFAGESYLKFCLKLYSGILNRVKERIRQTYKEKSGTEEGQKSSSEVAQVDYSQSHRLLVSNIYDAVENPTSSTTNLTISMLEGINCIVKTVFHKTKKIVIWNKTFYFRDLANLLKFHSFLFKLKLEVDQDLSALSDSFILD